MQPLEGITVVAVGQAVAAHARLNQPTEVLNHPS